MPDNRDLLIRARRGVRRDSGRARHRELTRDEAALFRRAMQDVAPLDEGGSSAEPGEKPARVSVPARLRQRKDVPQRDMPALQRGAAAGLDARTMTRLRRGQIKAEATLDLHGMTRDRAHRELAAFLARAQGDGKRCVIVVTGKGRLSEGGGVLRAELPHWLNLSSNRSRILGFAEAQPRDGGSGAVYVLLRRAKPTK